VGIICPGSQRLVSKGTDTIPGKAAALYDGKKTKTYSDQANFVPFIVEIGGRTIAYESTMVLDYLGMKSLSNEWACEYSSTYSRTQ
jgi:hypothetical protein